MPIRVVAGTAKGRRLRPVPGEGTRPVRDQVKEALFSILAPQIDGCTFLDLFAGTGSVGIEALSRGASHSTFVEQHPRAIETIRQNLEHTELSDRARVIQGDVFAVLEAGSRDRFDLAYVAPPQYSKLWSRAVIGLDLGKDWLNPDAWVIAQIHPKEHESLQLRRLIEIDRRKYSQTMLVFYEWPGE
ncbi:MAG: 16S rRNA (guanine(966)-N(2))-methyltransferase RsmD [Anaerolineales bacterium]